MFHKILMRMKCGQRALGLISMGLGLTGTGILSLAVVTDYWLFISEPLLPENITSYYEPVNDMDIDTSTDDLFQEETVDMNFDESSTLIHINVHSGLWRMCMTYDGMDRPICSTINYANWERISDADTIWSILRGIRKSSPMIVFSLLLMIIAFAVSTLGNYNKDNKTISGAVIYVFAALFLAVGVILYISAVNDEVAHRKKPTSDGTVFEYHYGWAFFFAGVAFTCSMMASVSNITLYLNRFPTIEDKASIIPGLDKNCGFTAPKMSSEDELGSMMCSQNSTIIL